MGLHVSAAAVLKAIRDGKATSGDELYAAFGVSPTVGYEIDQVLGELESAGLILSKDDKLTVTDQWKRIQGTLGISLTTLEEAARPGRVSVEPLLGIPDAGRSVPDVFVLMSFDPRFKPVFTTHISGVARDLGLTAGRADDFFTAHSVMEDVWTAVYRSRAVIADCTTRNPNVFYEIGMAHTIGKPVILITQNEADVPFDLKQIRYIAYEYTPPGMKEFEEKLTFTLRDVLKLGAPAR